MAILEMTNKSQFERKERLEELLEEFNLNDFRKTLGNRLSEGKKKNGNCKGFSYKSEICTLRRTLLQELTQLL